MVCCCVPLCSHRDEHKKCKFYRFPSNKQLCNKWLQLIRRNVSTISSRVCSCHFLDGCKENLPTIFEWNSKKKFNFKSPEKNKRAPRKLKKSECENVLAVINNDNQSFPTSPTVTHGPPDLQSPVAEAIPSVERILSGTESSTSNRGCCSNETGENLSSIDFNSLFRHSKEAQTQTKHEFSPQFYESVIYFKDKEIEDLKKRNSELQKKKFGIEFLQDDEDYIHYTGLAKSVYHNLCDVVKSTDFKYCGSEVLLLPIEDQVLITLLKLRHNYTYYDLALRFGCLKATISNIVQTFVYILHYTLFICCIENEIPSRHKNQLSLPGCFETFPTCRIILDCTEVPCERPSNMHKQRLTYSSYYLENTEKALVGVAPNGAVTYCSPLYPGSVSDKNIVNHCGILKHLKPGDLILADKGFLISDLLPTGVSLNVPPFKSRKQFTESEIIDAKRIARARIHIERAIRRIKSYKILNLIPCSLFPFSTKIIQLCAALVNLQSPILKESEEYFLSND